MADEANAHSPSGPGEGRTDHGNQPSSQEEGRHSSRHKESRWQIAQGPITHTDSMRNPWCRTHGGGRRLLQVPGA